MSGAILVRLRVGESAWVVLGSGLFGHAWTGRLGWVEDRLW